MKIFTKEKFSSYTKLRTGGLLMNLIGEKGGQLA